MLSARVPLALPHVPPEDQPDATRGHCNVRFVNGRFVPHLAPTGDEDQAAARRLDDLTEPFEVIKRQGVVGLGQLRGVGRSPDRFVELLMTSAPSSQATRAA